MQQIAREAKAERLGLVGELQDQQREQENLLKL